MNKMQNRPKFLTLVEQQLRVHPICALLGNIWEGFALEQVVQSLSLRPEEVFFWRAHTGAELDLFVPRGNQRIGFEFKFADKPRTSKSMHQAIQDLQLQHLYVIYPGQHEIVLTEKITAIGLKSWVDNPR